jgi:hypothetical protein
MSQREKEQHQLNVQSAAALSSTFELEREREYLNRTIDGICTLEVSKDCNVFTEITVGELSTCT